MTSEEKALVDELRKSITSLAEEVKVLKARIDPPRVRITEERGYEGAFPASTYALMDRMSLPKDGQNGIDALAKAVPDSVVADIVADSKRR
jgi:hypothetical protein